MVLYNIIVKIIKQIGIPFFFKFLWNKRQERHDATLLLRSRRLPTTADKHLAVPAIEQSWRVSVFGLGTEIQALHIIFWIQGEARGKLEEIN